MKIRKICVALRGGNRFYIFARLLLGGIFLFSSLDKIHHPIAFSIVVSNYQMLPDIGINIAAVVLPFLECVLGILLVFGWWMPGAVSLSSLLLTLFWGLLVYNYARGFDINCGCFSTQPASSSSILRSIVRDSAFLLLGMYLFVKTLFNPKS